MSFIPSKADKRDVSIYTEGSCHDFACAIHRHTGWPLLIVYDKSIPSIRNDDGETLHSLMHVACLDPDGNAWDVTGCVHRSGAARHYRKYMDFGRIGFDLLETAADLERYIGFGPYQVLSHQYDFTDEWADRDSRRVLREFGFLPPPMEFTQADPTDAADFEEDYAAGAASLNVAVGIGTHFGYPVAVAFGHDRRIVRAWAENRDGRPITSSGLLNDHAELDLPDGCFIRIWDVAHHAMADGRLRHLLGTPVLDGRSVVDAFDELRKAFPSVEDHRLGDGREVTSYYLAGEMRELLEMAMYEHEDGGLKRLSGKGRPHRKAMDAIAGTAPDLR